MIETLQYQINSNEYLSILFKKIFKRYWYIPTTSIIILAALSFIDIRWIFILLMCIFILIPFALAYLYIWHGLKQKATYSTTKKTVIINEFGLKLEFENGIKDISWDSFNSLSITPKALIFSYIESEYLFFIIPFSAFKSADDLRKTMSLIPKNITR
ncbi:MAG: hypothetical protein PHR45_04680 [Muribaculaceae bacterium]|nr:hypothetical protein [Muribaculaceae bacterium]